MKLTGHKAIRAAEQHGLALSKYADPLEPARDGLTVQEAREVAAEDPSLIWADLADVVQAEIRDHERKQARSAARKSPR